MQSYYQNVGQRVSTFFTGGGRQDNGNFQNMNQGGNYGGNQGGYGGQQQQMQGGYGGQQQMQGGYGGQQQMQGGYGGQQMQGGYGGQQQYGYGNQQQGMGGYNMGGSNSNIQFTQDIPRGGQGGGRGSGQKRGSDNLKKPGMSPGTRRRDGFQWTPKLILVFVAVFIIILAASLTAGLVVQANHQHAAAIAQAAGTFPTTG